MKSMFNFIGIQCISHNKHISKSNNKQKLLAILLSIDSITVEVSLDCGRKRDHLEETHTGDNTQTPHRNAALGWQLLAVR